MRHRVFISYHHDDQQYVDDFVEVFDKERDVFITRAVGVMSDDIINSTDTDYVMRRIRELYLTDSTVTIVLIGKCTWTRRYVDWEIASTLRNDLDNKRSGLLAITLPSITDDEYKKLPPRFEDNWNHSTKGNGYAAWYKYPSSGDQLAACIEEAFQGRDSLASLIDNSRDLFGYNRSCG